MPNTPSPWDPPVAPQPPNSQLLATCPPLPASWPPVVSAHWLLEPASGQIRPKPRLSLCSAEVAQHRSRNENKWFCSCLAFCFQTSISFSGCIFCIRGKRGQIRKRRRTRLPTHVECTFPAPLPCPMPLPRGTGFAQEPGPGGFCFRQSAPCSRVDLILHNRLGRKLYQTPSPS